MTWVPNISYIVDNVDRVSAKDTNRPLQQLDMRTQYLYGALLSSARGELILARNVPIDGNMPLGSPVCFRKVGNDFVYTLAKAEIIETLNDIIPTSMMLLRGILVADYKNGRGDVALIGKIDANIYKIDWTKVFEPSQTVLMPGHYYISATYPGKITQSRSLHAYAYIGSLDGQGNMILTPYVGGSLAEHRHLKFTLQRVVTTPANNGWISVSNFDSIPIPQGAKYGYNINKHPTLKGFFPPFPPSACQLYLCGAIVPPHLWRVTEHGIWWMSDSILPNNTTLETSVYISTNAPRDTFDLYVMNYNGAYKNVVESISTTPSNQINRIPIVIENALTGASTQENAFGQLRLSLNKVLNIIDNTHEGDVALKFIDGVVARSGPIISRIKPGAGIVVQGSKGNSEDGFYGTLTISSILAEQQETFPALVSLDNAIEDLYGDIPVIAFPPNRVSRIVYKVFVPSTFPGARLMECSFDCIGTASFSATLKLQFVQMQPSTRIIQTWQAVPDISCTFQPGFLYRFVANPFTVQPGSTVYIALQNPNAIPYTIPIVRFQARYQIPT